MVGARIKLSKAACEELFSKVPDIGGSPCTFVIVPFETADYATSLAETELSPYVAIVATEETPVAIAEQKAA
jgi:hypothetical protein